MPETHPIVATVVLALLLDGYPDIRLDP